VTGTASSFRACSQHNLEFATNSSSRVRRARGGRERSNTPSWCCNASTSICMNARERSESRKVRTSETRMDVIARSVSRSHNNINTTASTVFSVGTSVTLPAQGELTMKKSRGGRMTAAKARAAKRKGGKGPVSKRKAGRKIMKT